jgi:hypothetical protein
LKTLCHIVTSSVISRVLVPTNAAQILVDFLLMRSRHLCELTTPVVYYTCSWTRKANALGTLSYLNSQTFYWKILFGNPVANATFGNPPTINTSEITVASIHRFKRPVISSGIMNLWAQSHCLATRFPTARNIAMAQHPLLVNS